MASYLTYRNVLLNNSTVIASTLNAGIVSYSTLTGSTTSTRAATVSTLTGSSITVSTLTGSTIFVSTLSGSTINVSTMTASTILTAGSTISLARNVNVPNRFVEVGSDVANSMYFDFHSSDAALPDYSTRIQSLGGATTGTGGLNMYASTIGLVATNGVGIGTTVPSAALHVYGSSGLSLATTGTVNYTNTSILGFGFGGGSYGTRDSFRILSQPVNRDNGAGPFFDYGAQADLVFLRKTNNLYSSGASDMTYTEVMRIHGASGFVGIGTTNPTAPLYVKYGTNADSTGGPSGTWASILYNATNLSGANGLLVKNNWRGAGSTIFECGSDFVGGAYASLFTINGVGNVGIGTTNPANSLHVVGSATLQGSNCSLKFAGNSDNYILTTAADSFGAGINTNNFVVSSWYGLGFGDATNSHYATAYIDCRQGRYYGLSSLTSDKRMKKNIQPSTNCLDKINSIPVVSYDFIESHKPHVQYGVVAQDIDDILPEAVSITSNFIGDTDKIVTHIIDGDTITITSPSHGYHTGNVLRFTIDYANTADDKFHTTEITVIDDDTFTISTWDAYDSSAALYVYGKYVDDFHNIDTSHFTFLAIGGIKELATENTQLKSAIASLEARLAAAGL